MRKSCTKLIRPPAPANGPIFYSLVIQPKILGFLYNALQLWAPVGLALLAA